MVEPPVLVPPTVIVAPLLVSVVPPWVVVPWVPEPSLTGAVSSGSKHALASASSKDGHASRTFVMSSDGKALVEATQHGYLRHDRSAMGGQDSTNVKHDL